MSALAIYHKLKCVMSGGTPAEVFDLMCGPSGGWDLCSTKGR